MRLYRTKRSNERAQLRETMDRGNSVRGARILNTSIWDVPPVTKQSKVRAKRAKILAAIRERHLTSA
jgi:hypothetical protein